MLLSFDTLTESLFALFLAAALYLHARARPLAAAVIVSFLPTIRPEGFFVGIFWGVLMLLDPNLDARLSRRWRKTLILLGGTLLWFLASLVITGDPLYIIHNWPWTDSLGGDRALLPWLALLAIKFSGPVIPLLAIAGSFREANLKRWVLPGLGAYFFLFQVIFYGFDLFGSIGSARYFVSIAPITTLLALSGTEVIERYVMPRVFGVGLTSALLFSWVFALFTIDCYPGFLDTRAIRETYDWYRDNVDLPVQHLVWSQNYMCIIFDKDIFDHRIKRDLNREKNLKVLRASPPGTLVFFDARSPTYRIDTDDFEAAGYRRLRSKRYELRPLWVPFSILGECGPRTQEMHLYYKDQNSSAH